MKNLIKIPILLFLFSGTLHGQTVISGMEYFFDSADPGRGLATPVAISQSATINETPSLDISAIPLGLHTLNVRVKDNSGGWSLTHSTPFIKLNNTIANIRRIEYYLDSDPGFGQATAVDFTASPDITESFLVNTSGLQSGVHLLRVRIQDENGYWSHSNAVLFYVVTSIDADIVGVEYFFDQDPGFGHGTFHAVTPSAIINETFNIPTALLSAGFHMLHVRTVDSGGTWTLTHTQPVINIQDNNDNITAVEYFLDHDPGIGNGTIEAITPGGDVTYTFNVDLSGTSPGLHFFNVRTQNSAGEWSLTNSRLISVINAGTPDVSYVEYFLDEDPGYGNGTEISITAGSNVTAATTIDVSGLTPGVHVARMRVRDSYGNWSMVNSTPFLLLNGHTEIVALEYAIDTDPGIGNATRVDVPDGFTIEDAFTIPLNAVSEGNHIAMVRTMTADGVWGHTEVFPFQVCNILPPIVNLRDVTTNSVRFTWDSTSFSEGYRLDISADNFETFIPGFNDKAVNDTTDFVINLIPDSTYEFRIRAEGYCLSDNAIGSFTTYQETSSVDSTALVDIYNATDGENWSDNANWLETPVAAWHGITVVNGRVTDINLPSNGLRGVIPTSVLTVSTVDTINLSGNALTAFPNVSSMTILEYLDLAENNLTFEDLEPNIGIPNFEFIPQNEVGSGDTLDLLEGDVISIGFTIGGSANEYQWEKDGSPVAGEISPTLNRNATMADNGVWQLTVTNSVVTGLEIFSAEVLINVEELGIEADSLSLVELFSATGGGNWNNSTGWLNSPVSEWHGINVVDNKVVGVDLHDNNLVGDPSSLAELSNVTAIDLSGNLLTSIPDLSEIPLTSLDVSDNLIDFQSLAPNVNIPGIIYSPQKQFGEPATFEVTVRTSFMLEANVGGTGNAYQWKFEGENIGADADSFTIEEMGKADNGSYYCEVTNETVPGLTISTTPVQLIAVANIAGTLYANATEEANGGEITLFRITESEGYDTLASVDVGSEGTFIFQNVPLEKYQIMGYADIANHSRALPTFYPSTLYWDEADTVFLDSVIVGLQIITQLAPTDQPSGQGLLTGYVVEEVPDEGGRIKASKRVKNAGVSVRRGERSGRNNDLELVEYTFTDEDGEFQFAGLEDDLYRINVQYPGYPMDTTTTIDVTIGPALEAEKRVEAKVEEGKIKITELIVTGIWGEDYPADLFPNPAEANTRIVFPGVEVGRVIKIHDITGKLVLTTASDSREVNIDLKKLAKGIYLINIEKDQQRVKTLRLEIR